MMSHSNGRVKLIKSQFENLQILDSIERKIPFTRSRTSINLNNTKNESPSNPTSKGIGPKKSLDDAFIMSRNSISPLSVDNKRGSIKRSPAFRYNGVEKIARISGNHSPDTENIEDDNTKKGIDVRGVVLTDTLRKAIKNLGPLPNGPPPKKPPRQINNTKSDDITIEIKRPPRKKHVSDQKSLLQCISCIEPIYEAIDEPLLPTCDTTQKQQVIQKDQNCENENSHLIYMEPNMNSSNKSLNNCKCQNNYGKSEDVHYLCTNIENNNNCREGKNHIEENTYDEINLLVDLAYEKSNLKMENSNETSTNISLTRSHTEKRKNYIRMCQKSLKSKSGENNRGQNPEKAKELIRKYNSLSSQCEKKDQKKNSFDAVVKRSKLFDVCLLIGYNFATDKPYVKMKYPKNAASPPNIEYTVFPNKIIDAGVDKQDYTIILTDDLGRKFAYCRRVLPENFETCLPLTYCLITAENAPGFYFKILKEIEYCHGQPNKFLDELLQNMQMKEFPKTGSHLEFELPQSTTPLKRHSQPKISNSRRLSLDNTPKWLENNSNETICHGNLKIISRPNDGRAENSDIYNLFRATGPEILLVIFEYLLTERSVILHSKNISLLSSCVLALQSIIYPFKWKYVWISVIPENMLELTESPVPILAGTLVELDDYISEGIYVDLERSVIHKKQTIDEVSLLPSGLAKSLKITLDMVNLISKDQEKSTINILLSEAFIRFFVELFENLDASKFIKEEFLNHQESVSVKYFLEVFLECYMFKEFLENVKQNKTREEYKLFFAKILEKSTDKAKFNSNEAIEMIVKNFKIINKKDKKSFAKRLKDFLTVN